MFKESISILSDESPRYWHELQCEWYNIDRYNCWVVDNASIVEVDVSVGPVCDTGKSINLTTSVCQDPCFATIELWVLETQYERRPTKERETCQAT
jgi:hypothetical protein